MSNHPSGQDEQSHPQEDETLQQPLASSSQTVFSRLFPQENSSPALTSYGSSTEHSFPHAPSTVTPVRIAFPQTPYAYYDIPQRVPPSLSLPSNPWLSSHGYSQHPQNPYNRPFDPIPITTGSPLYCNYNTATSHYGYHRGYSTFPNSLPLTIDPRQFVPHSPLSYDIQYRPPYRDPLQYHFLQPGQIMPTGHLPAHLETSISGNRHPLVTPYMPQHNMASALAIDTGVSHVHNEPMPAHSVITSTTSADFPVNVSSYNHRRPQSVGSEGNLCSQTNTTSSSNPTINLEDSSLSQAAGQPPSPKRIRVDDQTDHMEVSYIPHQEQRVQQMVRGMTNSNLDSPRSSSHVQQHSEPQGNKEATSASNYQSIQASSVVTLSRTEQSCGSPHPSLPAISIETVYVAVFAVRAKWINFGLALGLSQDTLASIETDNHYKTGSCLRETLHKRIGMKPLTWRDVIDALRSPIVDRNDLAEKIEFNFLNKGSIINDLSGEPTLEELCALPVKDRVWYPLGVWLGVEEIILSVPKYSWPSDKLKWIFNSFLCLPIGIKQYKQLVEGLPLERKEQAQFLLEQSKLEEFIKMFPSKVQTTAEELAKKRKDPKYPILVRALVKVGQREIAEKVCFRKGVSLTHYLATTDPASNPPECVVKYAESLKALYKEMSVLPDPDWPPAMATKDHYTNLAIIKRERDIYQGDDRVEARDYANGRIDKILGLKEPIELEEVFNPIINSKNESRLTILMDGAPGVGKTTITRKLCIDWACGSILQEYSLVILVPLRELIISDKEVLMESILLGDDVPLKTNVLEHYINTYSGSNILFIFDGFDELTCLQRKLIGDSLLVKLIKGKMLINACIMITSRPYASKSLKEFKRVNRHVEILGFTDDQIADCMSQNLSIEKREELLQNLKERLDIKSLCYIPLNCRIVLFVYKRCKFELPETLTQLYEIFILHTVKHYADRISSNPEFLEEIEGIDFYDALPTLVKSQLDSLAKMAFFGIQEERVVFTGSQLQELDLLKLGLLTSLFAFSKVSDIKHFQFLHLTLQEFLAAKYLASDYGSNVEVLKLFREKISDDRFRMTFLFLAGLTKFSFLAPNEPLLKENCEFLSKSKVLFLSQLLFESRNESARILPLLKKRLDFSGYELTQFDVIVLSHVFSHTPPDFIWDKVDLGNRSLSYEAFTALLSERHHSNTGTFALGMVKTFLATELKSYNRYDLSTIVNFLAQKNVLVEAFFPSPEVGSVNCALVTKLCRVLADHSTLQRLSFDKQIFSRKHYVQTHGEKFPLCSKAFVHLAGFLDKTQLTKLILLQYSETFEDCSHCDGLGLIARNTLLDLIEQSQKLKTLDLKDCQLPEDAMEKILSIYAQKKTLTSVEFRGNRTRSDSYLPTGTVCTMLNEKKNLKICGMSLKVVEDTQVHITVHALQSGSVSSSIFNQLCEAVTLSSSFLHTLKISFYVNDLVAPLCHILNEKKKLVALSVNISSRLAENIVLILEAIEKNTSLITLSLLCSSNNPSNIDEEVVRALSEMIVHNKTICELTLDSDFIAGEYETLARAFLKNSTLDKVYILYDFNAVSELTSRIDQLKGEESSAFHAIISFKRS